MFGCEKTKRQTYGWACAGASVAHPFRVGVGERADLQEETAGPSAALPGSLRPGKAHCRSLSSVPIRLADFEVSNHSPLVIPSVAEGSAVRLARTQNTSFRRLRGHSECAGWRVANEGDSWSGPWERRCPVPAGQTTPRIHPSISAILRVSSSNSRSVKANRDPFMSAARSQVAME